MAALDQVGSWPVANASAVVLGPLPAGAGAGRSAVLASAGNPERPFAWASITKVLVALVALVAVEEGSLDLDEPAGPPGSTVRHLLAHASGLDAQRPVVRTEPGRRRIYSNAGFEALATVVADRTGMPMRRYLVEGVLEPLGMTGTDLPEGSSAASGAVGPAADLGRLAGELLQPRLVAASTLALASAVAFPGLAGVLPGYGWFDPCDWGLGLEVKGGKDRHWTGPGNSARTFGHFGQSGGFIWVDPGVGVACVALTDRAFGPWAVEAWPLLSQAVLEEVGWGLGAGMS